MRGGYRKGAGAKKIHPIDAKRRQITLTDDEYAAVKLFIKQRRSQLKNNLKNL